MRHDQYNPAESQQQDSQRQQSGMLLSIDTDTGDSAQKRKRSEADLQAASADDSTSYSYEPQKIVTPTNSLQSGKRNHVCDICGATFTRQHNLKSHFLTHTSSKKEFICSECGSEFRRSHDLKRHQKLHTGEKPFACNTCGRRFARADALGRHTKSSGEGGCVNSRKTSSDPGSTNHSGNAYGGNSPGSHHDGSHPDQFQSRSRNNSVNDHTSSTQISPIDPIYIGGPDQAFNTGPPGGRQPSTENVRAFHPTLPPLQAGFNFDKDRTFNQSTQQASNEGFMNTPRFGLSPAFDASRPASTHPLSFDRGTVTEGGGAPGNNAGPPGSA
ncbi:MAG: C2H2-type zinc finger protein, partial [Oxalobacteraceae bacterium]